VDNYFLDLVLAVPGGFAHPRRHVAGWPGGLGGRGRTRPVAGWGRI